MAAVTICSDFGAPKNKVSHCFHCFHSFPIYFPWSDGTDAMILVFWMLSFKPTFSLSTFTFIKRLFKFLFTFCHKGGVICIDYAKAFDCVDLNKWWKILKEMGIPDHLTCLLRNLYVGQEATVLTGHGTTDWFQIGKGVHQGCILSPCLFNLYAE